MQNITVEMVIEKVKEILLECAKGNPLVLKNPAPIVLFNTDGYYKPLKAVLDNVINAEFGREEYFSNVLLSEDLNEIADHLK